LEVTVEIVPIFENFPYVRIVELEDNLEDISDLFEVKNHPRTHKNDHCDEYAKFDGAYSNLVGKHLRKSVLKILVNFDFG
jgi:hypothetical protein